MNIERRCKTCGKTFWAYDFTYWNCPDCHAAKFPNPAICPDCGKEHVPDAYWKTVCPECWEKKTGSKRCTAISVTTGARCANWAIKGGPYCGTHRKVGERWKSQLSA